MNAGVAVWVGPMVGSLSAGLFLGLVYFGGLWWTSRRLTAVAWPGPFFLASFVFRLALLLGGMYAVTGARPVETACSLAGVLVARGTLTRRLGPSTVTAPKKENV